MKLKQTRADSHSVKNRFAYVPSIRQKLSWKCIVNNIPIYLRLAATCVHRVEHKWLPFISLPSAPGANAPPSRTAPL